ncbi:uncharacterized protein LOC131658833 [Vicia villosa]|uniref:uncharacterized protein LOC131658833 n=1 Tax=Vicia villosa TaxID=3911 RepID=UPI00273AC656|nr:uncharacterized protein LOC131658833 [Vicia villosa]
MAPCEALYGRRYKTLLCWYESSESAVLGPEIVQETTEKIRMIRERMKTSQSLQKSYHDKRRKTFEFQVDDHVFLRVNPLRKYISDPLHVVQIDDIQMRDNLRIEASPVRIEGREVKQIAR